METSHSVTGLLHKGKTHAPTRLTRPDAKILDDNTTSETFGYEQKAADYWAVGHRSCPQGREY